MNMATDTALREAIDWHLALAEGDSECWHDFVGWLEADEAHAAAYDRVVLDDGLLGERKAERPPTPITLQRPIAPDRPRRRRAPLWGAAIAATIVGGVTVSTLIRPAAGDPYSIEAPAGQSRTVMLDDGTRIQLNGGARLSLDHTAPRVAMLERGEALFSVHHNAATPFRVEAGGQTIEDVGTVFDLVAHDRGLRVAVAEGSVAFHAGDGNASGDRIVLKPGMALRSDRAGEAVLSRVDPAAVGGWHRGHLDFDNARLTDVAEELGWSTGATIRVDPALAERRFSGVLRSDRGADDAVRSLAALSGTRPVRTASGWTLDGGGAG